MPILTPAYPCMNSAYNVTPRSLAVMTSEFKRAHSIALEVERGVAKWQDLFEVFSAILLNVLRQCRYHRCTLHSHCASIPVIPILSILY